MSNAWNPWNYRESIERHPENTGIVGYKIHANDGEIGKIDEATNEVGASSVVVDTGPWIFGRRVLLPAGTILRIDDANEAVYVDLTKEQIKDSPELQEGGTLDDPSYRSSVGNYYGGFYL